MDADEIRTLLGDNIFERAKKYRKRIQQSTCTVNADGVRHISAMVQGSGGSYYYTQAWLRENGSFVSASCSCPYNQNGEGTYCKHIGALLLDDAEKNAPAPAAKPDAIPGVVRGAAGIAPEPARRDSYASGLEMLFGKKWHGETPESDHEARRLLDTYKEAALENLGVDETAQRTGFAHLEPELTLVPGAQPWLRLRISDGGRQYVVKSIPNLMEAVEMGKSVSYGKALAFVHRWDAFDEESRALLQLLRRQVRARQAFEAEGTVRSGWEKGPAGGLPLTGEGLDDLVELYAAEGVVGGYTLKEGLPVISLKVERRKGGVQLSCTPALSGVQGLDYAYLLGETTLWRMQREECRRVLSAFFAEMTEWEQYMEQAGFEDPEAVPRLLAIWEKYVSEKPRPGYRPLALSYSAQGTYNGEEFLDAEQITKNKLYIYTREKNTSFDRRFLMKRVGEGWMIDAVQERLNGWQRTGL